MGFQVGVRPDLHHLVQILRTESPDHNAAPLLQPVDHVGGPLSVQNMPGVGPHGQMRLGKSPPELPPRWEL